VKTFSGAVRGLFVLGSLVVASLLMGVGSPVAGASPMAGAAPQAASIPSWQQAMKHLEVPSKGCFTSSFPTIQWVKVVCTDRPYHLPQGGVSTGIGVAGGSSPQAAGPVGDSTDYTAQVVGSMSSATGSIPSVTCSSSPGCSVTEASTGGTANVFSLQLNTNGVTTSLCSTGNSGCEGWIQFIYDSVSNQIDMEPALIGFGGGTCPTGFGHFGDPNSCYDLSLPKAAVPGGVTIANLSDVSFTGSVAPGGVYTVAMVSSGTATAVADTTPIDASGQWTRTEFGIFGDRGGTQAVFSAGTTIQVVTTTNSNTSEPPTCPFLSGIYTEETNNLNLVGTPESSAGSSPGIVSEQSNVLTTAPSCVTSPAPISTVTSVSSSPDPSLVGQPVTLTASVSPTDGLGTVAFYNDGSLVPGCAAQSLTLVSGTYQATCVTSSLSPGSYSISAVYSGDDSYAGSTSTNSWTQVVNQIQTTTTVSSVPNPSVFGQTVSLTATVSPTDDGIGSSMAFYANGSTTPIGGCGAVPLSAVSGATYQAICTTSSLPVGNNGISATYSGDTDYAGSSGSLPRPQVVNRIPTATTLVSSVNPSIHHQPVTFTATVTPTDGGGGVTFYRGTTVMCANVGLTGGKAPCVDATLKVGTHAITAVYSGDTDYLGSTSSILTQKVKAFGAPAFITPTRGTPQSAPIGTPFTENLTAKVTDLYGNAVPGASVTFAAPTTGPSATFIPGFQTATVVSDSTGQVIAPILTANLTVGGPYDVTASIGAVSGSFVLTNAPAVQEIGVQQLPASIILAGGPTPAIQVNVENTGTIPTSGTLTMTDTLSAGIGFTGGFTGPPGWTCTFAGQVATCTLTGSIPDGSLNSLALYVDVTAPTGTLLTSTAHLFPIDLTPSDNTSVLQLTAGQAF
jgi:large repetitive protein